MISSWVTFVVLGVAALLFVVGVGTNRGLLLGLAAALLFAAIGLGIAHTVQKDGRDAAIKRAADHDVQARCGPYVVTNRHQAGRFIYFDCANDGRIREVVTPR